MKTTFHHSPPTSGYALVMVLLFSSLSLLVLGGALSLSSTTSRLVDRKNAVSAASTAGEAAMEKVMTSMVNDFHNGGESLLSSRLASYQLLVPTPGENPTLSNIVFRNEAGTIDRITVNPRGATTFSNLNSAYRGLRGYVTDYDLYCQAAHHGYTQPIATGTRQKLQFARVPLFTFGVFYGTDLELHSGTDLTISGRVHANGNLYSQTLSRMTFNGDVTATGDLVLGKKPGDPVARSGSAPTFRGYHDAGASSFSLPIGTNQSPASLHRIIEIPPAGELRTSVIGLERFYNKADMIVLVSNTTVVARSGAYNNFSTTIPWTLLGEDPTPDEPDDDGKKDKKTKVAKGRGKKRPPPPAPTTNYPGVLNTNYTFFNKRENKTILVTELNVEMLMVQYTNLTGTLGREPKTIFIADCRTGSASTLPAVRVINAEKIPSGGLTVVSPNALYVWGDFNAPSNHLGSTNTTLTAPAALIADAITIQSPDWNDTNGGSGLSVRPATNCTVNAAVITGIVPTGAGAYSGGLENVFRLLEDWSGDTLTFNGSIAVLYYSTSETRPWGSFDVYNAPTRAWSYDGNFAQLSKLPPNTPQLRTVLRTGWESVEALW